MSTIPTVSNTALPDWAQQPAAIRNELVRRVSADLLGPLDGEHEVIRGYQRDDGTWTQPGRVNDRYLVGKLAPVGTVVRDPERTDDPGTGDEDPAQGSHDGQVAQRVMARSSVGLTAVVSASTAQLLARCRWGQYTRQVEAHADGTTARVWQREPIDLEVSISLQVPEQEDAIGPLPVQEAGVVLRGRVASAAGGELLIVTVFLCNEQEPVLINKDERWLFQASLDLTAPDGEAVFLGREALHAASTVPESERKETAQLDMNYRHEVELAVGHGIGVNWDSTLGTRRGTRVGTAVLPRYEVGRTEAPGVAGTPQLSGLVTDMSVLAELAVDDLTSALAPLADGYRAWLEDEINHAEGLDDHREAAEAALAEARNVADAIQDGITLLQENPDALEAFRFANQAMSRQRVHTVAVGERRNKPDLSLREALIQADIPANRSWRPFQLAFILLCLPSLTDPAHPERTVDTALADLLFFPTGGGKTEAYLGLVAYTLAMRRLQGVVGDGEDAVTGRDGVAVIMRYTLRLLTAQQFQRAATLICAAELIRQHRAVSDSRYAGVPFRLGMWVGGGVTPNQDVEAKEWVEAQCSRSRGFSGASTPLQLTECPWCGYALNGGRDCRYDEPHQRFLVFCGDPECSFTAKQAPGEGIPVVTVDSQVYRLLPAFVIATIDKFAQLPWNGALATLFGRVDQWCERHGYRNPDLDQRHRSHWQESNKHTARGDLPAAATLAVLPRLRPPDLILQDEMHLVTGPLGTMAGLYEAAIDRLATWTYAGREVRPKVVASTATVRRAEQQAWALFWRKLRVFPPPVLDARRSFFAEQIDPTDEVPGRLYLGISAHGERLKQVELRVFASLMAAAQAMYEELGDEGIRVDPWMTTVGYFNAVRELAGMRRLAEDELRSKLRYTRFTTGLAKRTRVILEELTSRVSSEDIKQVLRRLFNTFDPAQEDEDRNQRPLDLLLATNMVSVGVDVPRLGSMVVVGQPKATAEYIQATSRVGRSSGGPGLVITLYNWARPRDLSHYETFAHYHATFYRQVEPLSVTPFSERALDKGLTAVLVAAIRHCDTVWNPNKTARFLEKDDPRIRAHLAALSERAEAVTANPTAGQLLKNMAQHRLDDWEREASLRPSLSYDARQRDDVALLKRPETGSWTVRTCPNSLRDTESQINLQIETVDPTYESKSQPEIILGQPKPDVDEPRVPMVEDDEVDESIDAAQHFDEFGKASP
ncbi:MAG: DISARM system helicase DrmA [bacterium]|nr:DISARM system helicase DrmA [bacterium]